MSDYIVFDKSGLDALSKLLDCIKQNREPTDVNNLIYIRDGKVIETEVVPENFSINETILDWTKIEGTNRSSITSVMSSQGCPFRCRFCSYRLNPLEYKTTDNLQKELASIKAVGGKTLYFIDDLLTLPEKRFVGVGSSYKQTLCSW